MALTDEFFKNNPTSKHRRNNRIRKSFHNLEEAINSHKKSMDSYVKD